jgi:small subunit ribosomal protein S12e
MSESDHEQAEVAQPVEEEKVDNIHTAIKAVLKKSLANNGVVKGLNEVVKALDRKEALLAVLSEDCEDAKYKKLVTSLCKANNIPFLEIEKRSELGEWLSQCKYDKQGVARKVRGCSSAAIKDFGEDTEALNFVLNHIKENGQ